MKDDFMPYLGMFGLVAIFAGVVYQSYLSNGAANRRRELFALATVVWLATSGAFWLVGYAIYAHRSVAGALGLMLGVISVITSVVADRVKATVKGATDMPRIPRRLVKRIPISGKRIAH